MHNKQSDPSSRVDAEGADTKPAKGRKTWKRYYTNNPRPNQLIRSGQLCRILGISDRTLTVWLNKGVIPEPNLLIPSANGQNVRVWYWKTVEDWLSGVQVSHSRLPDKCQPATPEQPAKPRRVRIHGPESLPQLPDF